MERKHTLEKTWAVCLLALVCTFLWGSAFPSIKTGYQLFHIESADTMSQILFAGIRFFCAGILAILIGSAGQKRLMTVRVRNIPKVLVLCMLQTVIQYMLFYIGLAHTTGVKGSILGGTGVLFSFLLAAVVYRMEKLQAFKWIGCIIGFLGIVLVNFSGAEMDFQFSFAGEGFMILSALSSSLSSIYLKKYSDDENPVALSGYQFMIGGLIMIVIGLAKGGHLQNAGFAGIALLAYMAFISAVAYSLWGLLLKYNPVSRITVFSFLNQVFGVILCAVILKENQAVTWQIVGALALVCLGIILVNRNGKKGAEAGS